MNNSVRLGGSWSTGRRVKPASLKLFGSHVAAEYRMWVNSRSVLFGHISRSLGGTGLSRTKFPWNSL